MNGARSKAVTAQNLTSEAQNLRDAGGRIRFAYAFSPSSDDVELRYLVAPPNQREFEMWTLKAARNVPSLAGIWPALGWYEREMMDLNEVHFTDHPEPYPLVLRHGDFTHINGRDPAPSRGRSHLPSIDAKEVQQLPFGPIRADVLESAEFTFFYVGEHIIHYQPNLFFKHRGMEKLFEDVPLIERLSSPNGSLGKNSRPRARLLSGRRAGGFLRGACSRKDAPCFGRGARAALQSPSLSRTSLPYDDVEGWRSAGQASRGEGQATQRAAHWKPLPSQHPGARRNAPDLAPGTWLGEALEALRVEFVAYVERLEASEGHLDRLITTGPLPRRIAFDQGATGPIERASGLDRIFGATILTRTTPNSPSRRQSSRKETPMPVRASGSPK